MKHTRLRPKPNMKNKKKITQDDKDYLEWLSDNINEGATPNVSFINYVKITGQVLQPTNID